MSAFPCHLLYFCWCSYLQYSKTITKDTSKIIIEYVKMYGQPDVYAIKSRFTIKLVLSYDIRNSQSA